MIRVIIADDEILSVRYLKKMIPWEKLGYEIVGEAANGKKALELYEKWKPQIVLSDIRMPVMDGVELSAELRKRDAQVKIILISAYRDFEYAKKAIQYDVSNYLLKHELSQETLEKELESVRHAIEKDNRVNQISVESRFKDVLYGNEEESEFFLNDSRYGNRYVMMVLRKQTTTNGRTGYETLEVLRNLRWEELIFSVRNAENEAVEYVTGLTIDEENQLLLFGAATNSMKDYHDGIWKIYQRLKSGANRQNGSGLHVICSGIIGVQKLPETFRALSYAVRYTVFMETGKMWELKDIPVKNPDEQLHLHEHLTELESSIKSGDGRERELLTELFRMVTEPCWNLTEFRYLTRNLDSMYMWAVKKYGIVSGLPEGEYGTVTECRDCYVELFEALVKQIRQRGTKSYSKAVWEVLEYVHEHYMEDITLETAGNVCGLNGVYLGQIFKKEVGISLTNYLTNYRCEQAKRLLTEGRYTVGEVSELVGYQTSQYFSRMFRKVTGMTPQEYKNGGGAE